MHDRGSTSLRQWTALILGPDTLPQRRANEVVRQEERLDWIKQRHRPHSRPGTKCQAPRLHASTPPGEMQVHLTHGQSTQLTPCPRSQPPP